MVRENVYDNAVKQCILGNPLLSFVPKILVQKYEDFVFLLSTHLISVQIFRKQKSEEVY